MKHLRSILAVVLAVVMVASLCVFPANAANDTATLKLTPIEAKPGEEFTTTLYVTDGSEIADFDVKLQYDPNVVQLVSAKANKNVDGAVAFNTATVGAININYSNVENTYEEMPIIDLVFKVDDEAGPESYEFIKRNPSDKTMATRLNGNDYLDVPIVCEFDELNLYTAGDIDMNGAVEIRDVTHLRRYLARLETLTDYQLVMADAYYDSDVNVRDAVYIQQYLALFDVDLGGRANVYFYNADGDLYATKSVVRGSALTKLPAVPARAGYGEGSWSLSADSISAPDFTAVSKNMSVYAVYGGVAPTPTPDDSYSITYHLYDNDTYLQRVGVSNPNEDHYSSSVGMTLKPLVVEGYQFIGWFDGQGSNATQVKTIAKGTEGDLDLFAHWEAVTYTINYECVMGNIPSGTYTVNQNTTLTVPTSDIVPSMSNYIFMGWTNEDGKLVKTIPAGTTGNQTFTSNWVSRRNMARTIGKLDDPLIFEDTANGRILFAYELGTIENVPLYQIGDDFDALAGIEIKKSVEKTDSIGKDEASAIAKTISKATTNSSTWTLAEDWNSVTNVSESYAHQHGMTVEEANTVAKTSSNTFSLSAEQGGSKVTTDSSNIAAKLSGSLSHESTTGSTTEKYQEFNVDGHIGKKAPSETGGVEYGVDVGYKNGRKTTDTSSTTNGWTIGSEISGGASHSQTNSANWNVDSSFSASRSVSSSQTLSKAMSDVISSEKSYGQSYANGGSRSESRDFSESNASSDQYENTVAFHTDSILSEATEYKTNGSMQGKYRVECVGTMHVFGIVGYDVATQSYFVTTYNVMDDSTHVFLDYSYDGTFTEYENGVLPFEIPADVYDYVGERTLRTSGLVIDNQTGMVTDYQGEDTFVFVPTYVSVPTLSGDNYRAVKVTGIEADAFSKNANIEGVILNDFVTEIPNGAFEGCTSLKAVYCPNVVSIGDNAFKGCSSLVKFSLPAKVTNIGTDAFVGVNELSVVASKKSVAESTVSSGAKKITLNIAGIADEMTGTEIMVPASTDSFALQGDGKSFHNLKVRSDAATTTLNGLNFVDCTGIPIRVSSEKLNLQAVSVNSPGYGMLLTADNTEVSLYDNTSVTSSNGTAIICRNMDVVLSPEAISNGVASKLRVSGNILACGNVTGTKNIVLTNGTINTIDAATFAKYEKGEFLITFDANGGDVDTASKTVFYGESIGALPVPTRENCTFEGWYTEDGTLVTDTMAYEFSDGVTLKAHWKSDWILASDLPEDGTVTNTKWTYDLTTRTTSNSSTPPAGYTQYKDPTWVWGPYGNWSGWSRTQYYSSDSRKVESRTVTDQAGYTRYRYWIYRTADGWGYGTQNYYTGSAHGSCTRYDEVYLNYQLPVYDSSVGTYGPYDSSMFSHSGDSYWFYGESSWVPAVTHTEWRYADRSKVYTYYYQMVEAKESSTEVTPSDTISNVLQWVQYEVN